MQSPIKEIKVRSILNKHKKRDEWFLDEYSINPYTYCQLNCVYCYTHGSKYGRANDLFAVKINAPELLEKALRGLAKKNRYGFIALASATEAWPPVEEKYLITRKCLEVIHRYRFPVHVLTKSTLVLRDASILKRINEVAVLPEDLKKKLSSKVFVTISISTLEESVARIFEPNAPSPKERLDIIRKIKELGLSCGVAYIPVLPYISDSRDDLEEMIGSAKEHGADYVFVGALTLYGYGKNIFFRVLEKHFPELLPKYRRMYSKSFQPSGDYQRRLYSLTKVLCRKNKISYMILEGE